MRNQLLQMKNQLLLIAVFLFCVAASCNKSNENGPIQQQSAQVQKVLSAIEGKSYKLSAYYSMDAAGNKADVTSMVACVLKDTIYFANATITRASGAVGEITGAVYTVFTYCDPASCYFSSQYNARKEPGTFTGISMNEGIFQMPFPLNQVRFTSYPPNGIRSGTQSYAPASLFFKDVDASNRLILYYDGIDNKTYYIELSRV